MWLMKHGDCITSTDRRAQLSAFHDSTSLLSLSNLHHRLLLPASQNENLLLDSSFAHFLKQQKQSFFFLSSSPALLFYQTWGSCRSCPGLPRWVSWRRSPSSESKVTSHPEHPSSLLYQAKQKRARSSRPPWPCCPASAPPPAASAPPAERGFKNFPFCFLLACMKAL